MAFNSRNNVTDLLIGFLTSSGKDVICVASFLEAVKEAGDFGRRLSSQGSLNEAIMILLQANSNEAVANSELPREQQNPFLWRSQFIRRFVDEIANFVPESMRATWNSYGNSLVGMANQISGESQGDIGRRLASVDALTLSLVPFLTACLGNNPQRGNNPLPARMKLWPTLTDGVNQLSFTTVGGKIMEAMTAGGDAGQFQAAFDNVTTAVQRFAESAV